MRDCLEKPATLPAMVKKHEMCIESIHISCFLTLAQKKSEQ